METKRISVDKPVLHEPKKPKCNRKRARKGFTLADQTVGHLEALVEDGEAANVSRAIDLVTDHYVQNQAAILVNLEPEKRRAFTAYCMQQNKLPAEMIAEWIANTL